MYLQIWGLLNIGVKFASRLTYSNQSASNIYWSRLKANVLITGKKPGGLRPSTALTAVICSLNDAFATAPTSLFGPQEEKGMCRGLEGDCSLVGGPEGAL